MTIDPSYYVALFGMFSVPVVAVVPALARRLTDWWVNQ